MNRLEELIQELCPDGVEYKKLGEIATISRGGNLQKKNFCPEGVPCIHYGQIYTRYGLFADKTFTFVSEDCAKKQKLAYPNDIVMAVTSENIEDVCKCVAWLGDEAVAVSGHTAIIHHNQNAKYLTYYFYTEMFAAQKRKLVHGTKVMEVTPDTLNAITIPVPSLPVQAEIVRILDNFTKLTAELTLELTARRKQYEYYRDRLLTFSDDVLMVKLGDVCILTSGGDVPSGHWNKEKSDIYNVPIYSNGLDNDGLYGYTDAPRITDPCVTIAGRGAGCGNAILRKEPFFPIIRLISAVPNNKVNVSFLYYCVKKMKFQIPQGGIPQLTVPMVSDYIIPLPPLKEQERIVTILDRFDALCNDLSSEIEARQKQYEYYRDKLLSF